ncbi:MAG: hypothetical protein M1820_005702 [Bogoriella megaspora]|nr:MAG: hypothetical protein M1820_005702 [Bogoriella megaspora]
MALNESPTRRGANPDVAIFEENPSLSISAPRTQMGDQPQNLGLRIPSSFQESSTSSVDNLLNKLAEQQAKRDSKQLQEVKVSDSGISPTSLLYSDVSPTGSFDVVQDNDTHATTPKTDHSNHSEKPSGHEEIHRLQVELAAAKHQIAHMHQEMTQNRITKHTLEQAMGAPSDAGFSRDHDSANMWGTTARDPLLFTSTRDNIARTENWMAQQEDAQSDITDPTGTAGVPLDHPHWERSGFGVSMQNTDDQHQPPQHNRRDEPGLTTSWNNRAMTQDIQQPPFMPNLHPQRSINFRPDTVGSNNLGFNNLAINDSTTFGRSASTFKQNPELDRPNRFFGQAPNGGWATSSNTKWNMKVGPNPVAPFPGEAMQSMYGPTASYVPQPIGTRLSATASDFTAGNVTSAPWGSQVPPEPSTTYMSTVEPLNYRRLLDRNVSCNWKYIVDKIVCNNDQQASIFLQQKLKVGTPEQKYEIVQAIIDQAYPLMVNRFGNFLVQRCFEHGTTDQIVEIAKAIRGNTLNLSMDAFGCHVVQKAFDAVPEEYKAIMVRELLRRIPETVIHRYACHVWQKLFELRWSDSPPQIMRYVNESLRGMWHEVALGETGSLVVQNIFENCLEDDKRPCINEVLASIDVVAHGQFGNWCIQHICEHGAPADRSRAIDHVLRFATEYSTDQFASKVVEKCLKVGGPAFLERYLERVTEGRPDRPRMPLIDIAADQFGNYLIQYILTHADPTHRDVVASHVRKHMVSLRGSKYGSRVAMLCCNPASATRPGPPAGLPLSRGNSYNASIRGAYGAYR